jgi:hypothetical protein
MHNSSDAIARWSRLIKPWQRDSSIWSLPLFSNSATLMSPTIWHVVVHLCAFWLITKRLSSVRCKSLEYGCKLQSRIDAKGISSATLWWTSCNRPMNSGSHAREAFCQFPDAIFQHYPVLMARWDYHRKLCIWDWCQAEKDLTNVWIHCDLKILEP